MFTWCFLPSSHQEQNTSISGMSSEFILHLQTLEFQSLEFQTSVIFAMSREFRFQ
uniref:Uncharacterized protein n=1 Tax=Arundo donax TaxID=35708 RepID=A0A0A9E4Q7_ARUDO